MDKVIYCEDNVYEIDTYIFDYLLEIGFDNVQIYPYNPINNIIRFEYNNTYVLIKIENVSNKIKITFGLPKKIILTNQTNQTNQI